MLQVRHNLMIIENRYGIEMAPSFFIVNMSELR